MRYFFEDSEDYDREIEVPEYIKRQIITDYLKNTIYWTVGLGCLLIGFLGGVIVRGI